MQQVLIDNLIKALVDYVTSHPQVIEGLVSGLLDKLTSHLAEKAAQPKS